MKEETKGATNKEEKDEEVVDAKPGTDNKKKPKTTKTKPKPVEADSITSLDLAKKAITKKYGDVLHTLYSQENKKVETISTGCISLDAAMGNGGMALGRIYEVYGPPSSGKSTLAQNVVVQAQRRGLRCLYIDAEHAVDPELFKNYGADSNNLDIVQGYDGEENLDILERLIKTNEFSVAVVDSVSALIPRAEAEADMDKDSMALQARLMSKALRKIVPTAGQTKTLVIFVNQVRSKVGVIFGNPEVTSGGNALGFFATGRLSVRGGEAKNRRLIGPDGEPYGHRTEFELVKNKLYIPFKKANVNLIYGQGYDAHWEILDLAVSLSLIDKTGSWYKYEGENIAQGDAKMLAYLKDDDNKDFYAELRESIIGQLGIKEAYESHSNPGPLYS